MNLSQEIKTTPSLKTLWVFSSILRLNGTTTRMRRLTLFIRKFLLLVYVKFSSVGCELMYVMLVLNIIGYDFSLHLNRCIQIHVTVNTNVC
ncbi:hypothetical protein ES332_D10G296700v1 [Gossypium tomentosum]|uniref:Uncharacterized protein n=1 Tax=Gossypium tomentosum TaxID=34277 RepID=A0A5D2JA74_GOSTO|nr:hypothetical protein ES332_D10G296700v1 [Gossypium tomentosum]